ncbi:porin family protein [Hymenobacter crusticola]|uniref:porin family protein n=1 Tax=Hymenobacter crusticola TaxID=1770526 RepID=UPI0015C4E854|nr:porin family protein [Hymenobacter crusticola]
MSLFVASTGYAQQVRFGAKAGLNASTYQGAPVPNPGFRFGPVLGVLTRLSLGRHGSLQPELLYEQRGATTDLLADGPNGVFNLPTIFSQQTRSRLHYLSLPMLARVEVGKLFAVAGPQVSYLVQAREQRTTLLDDPYTYNLAVPFTETRAGTEQYHRWELGGVVGVGYQVLADLAVELRYAAAVTPLRHSPPALPADWVSWPARLEKARTTSLQAQVSYTFGSE